MEEMSWWGNIESRLHLRAVIFLHQLVLLKDIWKTQVLGFHETKNYDPIMAATNLFGNIIIHPFEDGKWKWNNLLLDFCSCFHADEMLSISSNFKFLS